MSKLQRINLFAQIGVRRTCINNERDTDLPTTTYSDWHGTHILSGVLCDRADDFVGTLGTLRYFYQIWAKIQRFSEEYAATVEYFVEFIDLVFGPFSFPFLTDLSQLYEKFLELPYVGD